MVASSAPDGIPIGWWATISSYSCRAPPVKAELVPAQSKLMADGKTPPVIAVRLTDKDGHPARMGVLGEYSVDSPRLALSRVEELQKNPLTASASERRKSDF